MEALFISAGINLSKLSKNEKFLFESYFFLCLQNELFQNFELQHKKYLSCINSDFAIESKMLEVNFFSYIIKDILSTEEYSLNGIAYYTQTPEDVIYDLAAGINKNPSSFLWRKIIDLHSTVRRELYHEIIKKILYYSN